MIVIMNHSNNEEKKERGPILKIESFFTYLGWIQLYNLAITLDQSFCFTCIHVVSVI